MAQKYMPPKQSLGGQFVDAVVILVLVFLALFIPLKMELAGASKGDWLPGNVTATQGEDGATVLTSDNGLVKRTDAEGNVTFENLTWEALEQNPVMQEQWSKLGYDLEGAASAITLRYDYSLNWLGLLATLVAIAAYFGFLIRQSDKEYREVIAEKFGDKR